MDKLRYGFIGAGTINKVHAERLAARDDVLLAAVADVAEAAGDAFAERFNVPGRYTDAKAMLAAEGLDAVVVGVPNAYHAPSALLALEAGCHVLIEKPPAMTAAQAKAVAELAERKGLRVQYGLNMRFHGESDTARSYLDAGRLGEVYQARDPGHGRLVHHQDGQRRRRADRRGRAHPRPDPLSDGPAAAGGRQRRDPRAVRQPPRDLQLPEHVGRAAQAGRHLRRGRPRLHVDSLRHRRLARGPGLLGGQHERRQQHPHHGRPRRCGNRPGQQREDPHRGQRPPRRHHADVQEARQLRRAARALHRVRPRPVEEKSHRRPARAGPAAHVGRDLPLGGRRARGGDRRRGMTARRGSLPPPWQGGGGNGTLPATRHVGD
ncbi:MAG: Gfo/Idh/MocA family oxidoreductase [Armatimonadetes bacterium]|nr:Gfo/Idh/MocA family oxidoreductase [Armatimonadota bacterium]